MFVHKPAIGILPMRLKSIFILILAIVICDPTNLASGQNQKHALLVGVTEYPNLSENKWLSGPANDVEIIRELLVTRLGFSKFASNMVTLVQKNAPDHRPSRKNIVREFERLIERTESGDQVFILMSGHGTQQPNDNQNSDPEHDLMDEVFLANDVTSLRPGDKGIPNAIIDDEINQWLRSLAEKGVFTWIVFDSCHSGTMLRGASSEVSRNIDPDDLNVPEISGDVAEVQPGVKEQSFEFPNDGGVVAFYASKPAEQAIETDLPKDDSAEKQRHGLLSFAICKALATTQNAISFDELMSMVRMQYTGWGRNYPTPLIEGTNTSQAIFGKDSWENRAAIQVTRVSGNSVYINGGTLHGYYPETKFRVLPKSLDDNEPIGSIEIVESWPYRAKAKFTAGNNRSPIEVGSRCELEYVSYSLPKLKVTVDGKSKQLSSLTKELKSASQDGNSLYEVVDDPNDCQWVIRNSDSTNFHLIPASGVPSSSVSDGASEFVFSGEDAATKVSTALQRIARVQNLMNLASSVEEGWDDEVIVDMEILKLENADDKTGMPLKQTSSGLRLTSGEHIGVKITNQSFADVDVFLFFIDSNFGIADFVPSQSDFVSQKHHLRPKEDKIMLRGKIDSETVGKERFMLIARRTSNYPVDLRVLAQDGVDSLGFQKMRGNSPTQYDRLLEMAAFGTGRTRGAPPEAAKDYAIQMIEWTTQSDNK